MFISILIPAYNEAERIGATVRAVQALGTGEDGQKEIIVIDDGSRDETAAAAAAAGAKVIRLEKNQGKGAALNAGIRAAQGDVFLFLDADLGESAREAEKLLRPLREGRAAMAIAAFPPARRRGGFGLATRLARRGIAVLTGRVMQSPLSGQRALRREVLAALGGRVAAGFGVETAMTIDALRLGWAVEEVPVEMFHAETGRDLAGFAHRGKQFLAVLAVLLPRFLGAARKGAKAKRREGGKEA